MASSSSTGTRTEATGDLGAPDAPLLFVIIVTWNSEPDLPSCLEALSTVSLPGGLHVLCVDNGSVDDSTRVAERYGADVLTLGENVGFPKAVNRAFSRSCSPYVLLLNPDVIVEPAAIPACVTELASADDVVIVGCNLRRPDGTPDWPAARRFRSLGAITVETLGLTRLSRLFDYQYYPRWDRSTDRDVPCVNGAFALIRASFLRELGGLDESAFLYLEDQELCRQAHLRGKRVRFVSDATATHQAAASTARSSVPQQTLAYLHRLDADIEFIARTSGALARRIAILLFLARSALGLIVAALGRRPDATGKYAKALSWLPRQTGQRRPPPPIPNSHPRNR